MFIKKLHKSVVVALRDISLLIVICILTGCAKQKSENVAAGGDSWEIIKKNGVLKIGTDATYLPFEVRDPQTGELVGFDIDLMKEICRRLQIKPEFHVVSFDGIIAGLKTKKYDVIISAMTITEERSKEVSFSIPYYLAGQSIAVHVENNTIRGLEDLKGKKIGVQLGTTGEIEARKIKDAQVVPYEDINTAFIDLANKNLDAVINDIPTTRAIVSAKKNLKIVGALLTKEYYGIAVRKEDATLLQQINRVLEEIIKDGTLEKLKKKWMI